MVTSVIFAVGIVAMVIGLGVAAAYCMGWVEQFSRYAGRRHKERRPASSLVVRDALFSAMLRQNYTPRLKAILNEPSLFDRVAPNTRYVDLRIEDDNYTWQRVRKPAVDSPGNDVPEHTEATVPTL